MIDAVLSYHLNPLTCGVAKFNQQLAHRLGVPLQPTWSYGPHSLVSLKPSESRSDSDSIIAGCRPYDVLLHDRTMPPDHPILSCARRVFYADEIGLPSTIDGNPTRGVYLDFTFGMAHKLVLAHFEQLKTGYNDLYVDWFRHAYSLTERTE